MVDTVRETLLELKYLLLYTDPFISGDADRVERVKEWHFLHMRFRSINTCLPSYIPSRGDDFEDSIIGYFVQAAKWVSADEFMAHLADVEQITCSRDRTEFTQTCIDAFLAERKRMYMR